MKKEKKENNNDLKLINIDKFIESEKESIPFHSKTLNIACVVITIIVILAITIGLLVYFLNKN